MEPMSQVPKAVPPLSDDQPIADVTTTSLGVAEPEAISRMQPASSDFDRVVEFESRKKSMAMAYLLWWALGTFGGHRFYFGRTGSATAMLCLTLTSFLLMFVLIGFVTIFVSVVWALVDAFQIPGWVRQHNAEVAKSLSMAA